LRGVDWIDGIGSPGHGRGGGTAKGRGTDDAGAA
jgi:hypothetical protein